jgi:hypothetical protein
MAASADEEPLCWAPSLAQLLESKAVCLITFLAGLLDRSSTSQQQVLALAGMITKDWYLFAMKEEKHPRG